MPIHRLSGLIGFPLAGLPSATSLATGTSFEITDYGGNISTAVNGVWRFEYPFRTTWAGRPAVNLVPVGTELQVTDYNNQKFISDGMYWRPAQGRISISQQWGYYSTPLSVISGATAGNFTIPNGNPKIPAGMIIPGSTLRCKSALRKVNANATVVFSAQVGTNGGSADAVLATTTSSASTNLDVTLAGAARFGSQTTRLSSIQRVGDGFTQGSTTGAGNDGTAGVNTAADMYLSIRVSSGSASDIFNLIGYELSLEA